MDNNDKIYYLGKASQLVLDLEADICSIDQIVILAEILREHGEEEAKKLIILGEIFKEFLNVAESELDD